MTSVRVKFRPSTVDSKEGHIYYQIIHNRVIRQLKTKYKVYEKDWDNGNLNHEGINSDLNLIKKIINNFSNRGIPYTIDDIIFNFKTKNKDDFIFNFMQSIIYKLKEMGKERTSETYYATLRSFMKFRNYKDMPFDEINSEILLMYQAYLQNRGITKNTISFYMRILRAIYNRAVEKGFTQQYNPFKRVYTGIDKTVKRALTFNYIKQIKDLNLENNYPLSFARDMFMFSFYTRGMSFIDMANLKATDLNNSSFSYRRHKTGQLLTIKWEKCMQDIVIKYANSCCSPYLLPIYTTPDKNRNRYKNIITRINKNLKTIAEMLNISIPLTLYVARHSWASIAKYKNIPISIISDALGHDNELTTQIYLSSLDNSIIDKANAHILKGL